jgi:purine nucleoside phosphorylase
MDTCALDEAVSRALAALERRKLPAPAALYSLGTGAEVLASRLERAARVPFSKLDGAPPAWAETLLHHGSLAGLPVWLLDHAPLEPEPDEPPWQRAFPIWLAAAAGASTLLHTTAGSSLAADVPAGTLGLVTDHVNASGTTPLVGLRGSRLGPQFPDQTRVHDPELRRAACELGLRLGLAMREVVAACTLGPSLETPAERRCLARAGAQVSAQGLAAPLVASAHAGLGGLAIVVVTHEGDGELDIARIAARSEALAPALHDLLVELAGDVQRRARERLDEEGR